MPCNLFDMDSMRSFTRCCYRTDYYRIAPHTQKPYSIFVFRVTITIDLRPMLIGRCLAKKKYGTELWTVPLWTVPHLCLGKKTYSPEFWIVFFLHCMAKMIQTNRSGLYHFFLIQTRPFFISLTSTIYILWLYSSNCNAINIR
jgi:hypothetical protein